MNSPHLVSDSAGDLIVAPTTPVLHARELYPDTNLAELSRFGDPVWDLFPALPDRHSTNQAIHWDTFPASFRRPCKLYVFALLSITADAPRLSSARTEFPSVKTIWADLGYLRVFLGWLMERGITRFANVTAADLDHYLSHITDEPATSATWKRKALLAVQRLHAYRMFLPEHCRLPGPVLWGGASAAELAGAPDPRLAANRTPRIHPTVMEPLLSAALLFVETIATDLMPAARRLVAMRALALRVAPDIRRQRHKAVSRWHATREQLACFLSALADVGQPLPGLREGGATILDVAGLALVGDLDRELLDKGYFNAVLGECELPITKDLLRVTRFTAVDGTRPWRHEPVDAAELLRLIRHLTTACFLVIAYLSGVRVGEALNLRRGCISHDAKLGLTFMSGQQLKAGPDRRERSPETIPWVVNEHGAAAVSVLEDLAVGPMLFAPGKFGSPAWLASTRCRTIGSINDDIRAYIGWFNTSIAATVGHPVIGTDQHGKITASRLRRTLAWHIVRRPGGTVAGATQYGHLSTQITQGYAGQADAGFLDVISFEEFLLRAETIHDDHQRLLQGEHVSGPAAVSYRERAAAGSQFAGLTITTPAQVSNALANPNLQVHHGALLTCVYRHATAACQDDDEADNGPSWPRCRLACSNIARTDRDVAELRQHVLGLKSDLAALEVPAPLRRRMQQRLELHERAIAEHEASRRQHTSAVHPEDAT